VTELEVPTLDTIRGARQRIQGIASRTPLVRLNAPGSQAQIYLKLENLQPVGSFKLRGAANAILSSDSSALAQGVWTASAGNMGYALAWYASRMGIPCGVIVPDDAPRTKLEAIARCGAEINQVPFHVYQQIQLRHSWAELADFPPDSPLNGLLVHPFGDRSILAGSATIGEEILEDMPDVNAVLVPYGGGGLSCGVAAALCGQHSTARVFACEVETAAPLAASLAAGEPQPVSYHASFVSGMGAPYIFPEMWSLAKELLAGSFVVSLQQVRSAIQMMAANNHIIAEGAGAVAVAAALANLAGSNKVVCIVSGGNIDRSLLVEILQEESLEY
jgi:threonine dehydratase